MSVINCPHCGKEVFKGTNGAWLFGSPIQTCKACGGRYLNKFYHEIEIDGIPESALSTKDNGKMLLFTALAAAVLLLINIYTITSFGWYKTGLVIAFLLALVFFVGILVDTIKIKSGKKQKELEKERQASVERLQNREYALLLQKMGYSVPEKYL